MTSPQARLRLKKLLARELDTVQIALHLGITLRQAEEFILFMGWADLLQPTRFKEAKRKAWDARQKLLASSEQMEVLGEAINWGKKVLRDEGLSGYGGCQTDMVFDLLEEEAKCLFVSCLRKWEPAGGASFKTYFWKLWKLKLLNVKQKVCEMYKLYTLIEDEKKLISQAC